MNKKLDYLIVFLVSFITYLWSMAPTIWWGDTGDLITSAYVLGVPHPTGYPTYVLLAKIFTFLPIGDIAFRVNLMSVFFGALTILFVYICTLLLTKKKVAGYIAAFSLTFSAIFWSQALIAEVYVLSAFFLVFSFYFLLRWRENGEKKYLYLLGLFFGIGLGVHRSLALFIPAILVYLGLYSKQIKWKNLIIAFLLLLLGLSVYAYLPLASMNDPLQDWGNPANLDNFIWLVQGKQYTERYFKLDGFFQRVANSFNFLISQFIVLGFSLVGIYYFIKKDWKFLLFGLTGVGFNFLFAGFYDIPDLMVYYIPTFIIFSIFIGSGIEFLLDEFFRGKFKKVLGIAIIFLVVLSGFLLYYPGVSLRNDYSAREFGERALNIVDKDALLFTKSDVVFIFWYLQNVEGLRRDVVVINQVMLPMDWYRNLLSRINPGVIIDSDIDKVLNMNKDKRSIYYADVNYSQMSYKELSKKSPVKI